MLSRALSLDFHLKIGFMQRRAVQPGNNYNDTVGVTGGKKQVFDGKLFFKYWGNIEDDCSARQLICCVAKLFAGKLFSVIWRKIFQKYFGFLNLVGVLY